MKKQILFSILLVLFAGTIAFGQALPGSAPRGVNCADSPQSPIAGKPYIYEAAATPAGGLFTFWATKDVNFISTAANVTTTNIATRLTTPTDLLATSANYATGTTSSTVSITWSDAVLSGTTSGTETFVAAHYAAPAVGGCADNFKAWQITPIKAFTVDIRNMDGTTTSTTSLAYGANEDQCLDIVRGASFSGGSMVYDYGTQILYFEVVAANFTNSWTPSFELTNLHAAQTSVIEWTYQNPATTPFSGATVWNPAATMVTTNETNTSVGVSIYVRVTITNNNYEGIADRNITLAVDGVNSVNEWDIANNTLTDIGPLCLPGALNDRQDVAMQTLKLRPTVTPVTPPAFIPGNNQN